MNDTLLKSYNRSFNGGKSRFARICDNVFSALLLTAALYLLVSRKLHHGAASLFAAMLISASILLTASLLRSLRFNAHIKKLRRETSESILRRKDTRFARSGRSNPQSAPFILGIPESSVSRIRVQLARFICSELKKQSLLMIFFRLFARLLKKAFRTS